VFSRVAIWLRGAHWASPEQPPATSLKASGLDAEAVMVRESVPSGNGRTPTSAPRTGSARDLTDAEDLLEENRG
jgi:hypothetical protein